MKKNQVDLITMGCSKNLVDSEIIMKQLEANGFHCIHDSKHPCGEIVVINTCGFIEAAKEESINMILEFIKAKEEGRIKKLYVMGCLSQKYQKELEAEMPQVDKYYGKFNYKELLKDLGMAEVTSVEGSRHLTTPHHYAYLKISEGCDRNCAYCSIPIITGHHTSRPMEQIVAEVEQLVSEGVKEFQVIAQELTYYGVDIYGKRKIAELIEKISDVKGVRWIRLHYAYPHDFPFELLKVINDRPNVCKYLDIALQHISDNVLSRMHRHVTKEDTVQLVKQIREQVPGIHIRTTFMVGFPGETEDDFRQLMEFVEWAKFERMGAFIYSEEEGTYSAEHYTDDVPWETKQRRLDELMALQQKISTEIEAKKVGQVMPVIIDRKEGDYYIGRTEYCSPEVDPEVLIPTSEHQLRVGNMYNIRMVDSDEFDLFGTLE
jgi:ribosomal protein S12 methylthiotransferase